jgi:hypothetical protein
MRREAEAVLEGAWDARRTCFLALDAGTAERAYRPRTLDNHRD